MQTRELHEYCERRGWSVAGEYVDLGISGVKEKRPELDRLMADAHLEQVASLVARVPEPIATLILFIASTGVRVGEAVGIKWSDFEGDVLHISGASMNGGKERQRRKARIGISRFR